MYSHETGGPSDLILQFYEAVGSRGSGEILDIGKNETSYGSDHRSSVRVLEDFNVRTLFDKLEDQNLHLTSQLGRHRNETLSFYKAFIHRIQVLKEMLQTLELGANKSVEWRKIPLQGEEESTRATMTSQQSQSSSLSMNQGYNTEPTQGVFMQEATALMKVVNITLMKVSNELAAKKNTSAKGLHNHVKGINSARAAKLPELDQTSANKNAYEGLMNGHIPMLSYVGSQLHPQLFMMALYREENLKKLLTVSPLSKTLEEIKQALNKQPQEKEDRSTEPVTIGSLAPMDMSRLSPRQLVVFRFGSALLHLVCHACSQSPLLLLIAHAVPRVRSPGRLTEDLHLGDSYYDPENKTLFVPSTSLDHVGELAAIIVHAVARIITGLHQTPINSEYVQCMNGAVRAISSAFFRSWGAERPGMLAGVKEGNPDMKTTIRDLLMIHKLPDQYQTQRSCEFYSKFRNLRIMENVFVKNSGVLRENSKEERPDQMAAREEAIDALNEEFLQLVTKAMENQKESRELSIQPKSDQSMFNRLAEKRDLAILLEIQRRRTSEKISAAECELLYLHPNDTMDFHTSGYNQDK